MVDFNVNVANPIASFLSGYSAMQEVDANRAREQRAAELQDLSLQQGQQGLAADQQDYDFKAQIQPYRVQEAEMGAQTAQTEQSATDRQTAYKAALNSIYADGTVTSDELAALNKSFPEFAIATKQAVSEMNAGERKAATSMLAQSVAALKADQADVAKAQISKFADAAEAAGDEAAAASARASLEAIDQDPKAALMVLGNILQVMDPDVAVNVLGTGTSGVQTTLADKGPFIIQTISRDGTITSIDARTNKPIPDDQLQGVIEESLAAEREQRGGIKTAETAGTLTAKIDLGAEAARQEALGTISGKALGDRIASAGSDIERAQSSLDLIDSIINDPKLPAITGRIQGRLPASLAGQGGDDLSVKIQQLKGKVFLRAFDDLKGGGAITEEEGKKAAQAMARLQREQSLEAYQDALSELRAVYELARQKAERVQSGGAAQPARTPSIYDSILGGE